MFIINQSYEKAKMMDIERNVANQQQILEYMVDETPVVRTTKNTRPKRKVWLVVTGLVTALRT